jgi:hypothetical protein
LELCRAINKPFRGHLGAVFGCLGPFWGNVRANLDYFGIIFGAALGSLLDVSRLLLEQFQVVLGLFRGCFGLSNLELFQVVLELFQDNYCRGYFMLFLGHFGAVAGHFRAVKP